MVRPDHRDYRFLHFANVSLLVNVRPPADGITAERSCHEAPEIRL